MLTLPSIHVHYSGFRVRGLGFGVTSGLHCLTHTDTSAVYATPQVDFAGPLSSEYGTHKPVKVRFWPWLSGKGLQIFQVVPSSLGRGMSKTVSLARSPTLLEPTPEITVCKQPSVRRSVNVRQVVGLRKSPFHV